MIFCKIISLENTLLLQEFSGKGTTDGIFRKQRFFTCASDSALFVTVNRLRICTKSELFKPSTEFDYGNIKDISGNSPVEHEVLDDRSLSPPPLEIGWSCAYWLCGYLYVRIM